MSIQKIIQESINKNPLEVKEALAEELKSRISEALAAKMEEVDLDEAVEVRHDRYMRSHGKKARDTGHPGSWMFTHKEYGTPDYNDDKEVHTVRGKFSDAKKSAQKWAKEHGHRSVYVMESVEQIDEGLDFQNKTSRSGASTTHIYHNGKHLGTIAKHFTKSNPNGSYRIQYNSDTIPAGSKGLHAHEGLPSQDAAKKLVSKHVNESVEHIDELDRKTLHSYLTKSSNDLKAINTARKITANDKSPEDVKHHADLTRKAGNRKKGFSRAYDRLAKGEVELGEAAEKPAHQYYATTQYMRPSEMKMLHDKKKPFATEREAFDHIKKQGGRQDGTIHKVHTATGKIISLRHVAGGQAGYVSDVGRGDPKHLSELPK